MEFVSLAKQGFPDFEINADGQVRRIGTTDPLAVNFKNVVQFTVHKKNCGRSLIGLIGDAFLDQPEEIWQEGKYAPLIRHWKQFEEWKRADFIRQIVAPFPSDATYYITRDGRVFNSKFRTECKSQLTQYKYAAVRFQARGRLWTRSVHRLVAEAFIPIPKHLGTDPDALEVNHKNGNHLDNRVENLEWVKRRDNEKHAVLSGFHLSDRVKQNLEYICRSFQEGLSNNEIANQTGISTTHLHYIRSGRSQCVNHWAQQHGFRWDAPKPYQRRPGRRESQAKQRDAKARELFQQGMRPFDIAREMSMSHPAVARAIRPLRLYVKTPQTFSY